jgi:hypothetical protein
MKVLVPKIILDHPTKCCHKDLECPQLDLSRFIECKAFGGHIMNWEKNQQCKMTWHKEDYRRKNGS